MSSTTTLFPGELATSRGTPAASIFLIARAPVAYRRAWLLPRRRTSVLDPYGRGVAVSVAVNIEAVADLSGGLLVLGGTALGGVIASGTAFLQHRWARRRDEEARARTRFPG